MKKIFAFFVCALFLFSIISVAEAQRPKNREQLLATGTAFRNLNAAQKSKLSQLNTANLRNLERKFAGLMPSQIQRITNALDPTQLRRLNQLSPSALRTIADNPAAISARVSRLRDVRVQATNANAVKNVFKARPVAASEVSQAKQRFQAASDRYNVVKADFLNKKTQINSLRDAYVLCKNSDTSECEETKNNFFERVKSWAIKTIESLEERTSMHIERVKESADIDEDKANEIIAELEQMLTELGDLRSRVEAATTTEELKPLLQELKTWTVNNLHRHRFYLVRLWWGNLKFLSMKINRLTAFIENAISRLEENGYDTTELQTEFDNFQAKIDEVRDRMSEAKDLFLQAKQLQEDAQNAGTWNEETRDEFQSLIKQVKEKLSEAKSLFREALQMFKDLVKEIRALLKDQLGISVSPAVLLDPEATTEVPAEISDIAEGGEIVVTELEDLE